MPKDYGEEVIGGKAGYTACSRGVADSMLSRLSAQVLIQGKFVEIRPTTKLQENMDPQSLCVPNRLLQVTIKF